MALMHDNSRERLRHTPPFQIAVPNRRSKSPFQIAVPIAVPMAPERPDRPMSLDRENDQIAERLAKLEKLNEKVKQLACEVPLPEVSSPTARKARLAAQEACTAIHTSHEGAVFETPKETKTVWWGPRPPNSETLPL